MFTTRVHPRARAHTRVHAHTLLGTGTWGEGEEEDE